MRLGAHVEMPQGAQAGRESMMNKAAVHLHSQNETKGRPRLTMLPASGSSHRINISARRVTASEWKEGMF